MSQCNVRVSELLGVLSVLCAAADARVHAYAGYVMPMQRTKHTQDPYELQWEAARNSAQGVSTTHPCMLCSNMLLPIHHCHLCTFCRCNRMHSPLSLSYTN